MADTTNAGYLSIGEVLELLLEEFPDVTISKIRFLESQGLISPERTSSGYRKFYDDDVQLLRVILAEQRENYLPLRVIKDRIATGQIDPTGEHLRPNPNGTADIARPPAPAAGPDPLVPGPVGAATGVTVPGSRVSPVAARDGSAGTDHTPAEPAAVPSTSIAAHPAARQQPTPAAEPASTAPPAPTEPAPTEPAPTEPAPTEPAPTEPAPTEPPPTEPPPAAATIDDPVAAAGQVTAPPTQLLPGVLLDRAELCAMVGMSDDELSDLESFGVVSPLDSSGLARYGEDAVEIARPACAFLRAGVDARHLRNWRTAAEREAMLFEQLVTPRFRQRNPTARAQALAELRRLDELGAQLRAALTKHALHHHFEA